MAVAALAVYGVWAALAFGLRTWVSWRTTGDTGLRMSGGRLGTLEWWARVLFVVALAVGLVAPVLDLVGAIERVPALDTDPVRVLGTVIAAAGVVGTLATQLAMGDSWRIGVDPDERTTLVTGGVFAVVRNPIFTAMAATAVGLALMVPNLVALAGLLVLALALELQVRGVEEPYLMGTHGEVYVRYAAGVGRFVPGVGRLRRAAAAVRRQGIRSA